MIDNIVQQTLHGKNKNNSSNSQNYNYAENQYDYNDNFIISDNSDNSSPSPIDIEKYRYADMNQQQYDPNKSTLENAIYTISKDSYLAQGAMMFYQSFDCASGVGGFLSSSAKLQEVTSAHSAAEYAKANKVLGDLGMDSLNLDHYYSREDVFKELQNVAINPKTFLSEYPSMSFKDKPFDVKINISGFDNNNCVQAVNNIISLGVNDNTQIPITYKQRDDFGNIKECSGFASAKNLIFGDDSKFALKPNANGDYSKNVAELCKSYSDGASLAAARALSNEKTIVKALDKLKIKNVDKMSINQIERMLKKNSIKSVDGKTIVLTYQMKTLLKAEIIAKKDKTLYEQHNKNKKRAKIALNKISQNSYKKSDIYQGGRKVTQAYKVGRALTNATCSSVVFASKQSHKFLSKTKLGQKDAYKKITSKISDRYEVHQKFNKHKKELKENLKHANRKGRKELKRKFRDDMAGSRSLRGKLSNLKGNAIGNSKKAILTHAPNRLVNLQSKAKRGLKRLSENKTLNLIKKPFRALSWSINGFRSVVSRLNPLNLVKKLLSMLGKLLAPIAAVIAGVALALYTLPVIIVIIFGAATAAASSAGSAVSNTFCAIGEFIFGDSDEYTVEEDPYSMAFGDPTSTPDGKYPYTMENVLIDHPKNILNETLYKFYNQQINAAVKNKPFSNMAFNNSAGDTINLSALNANTWAKHHLSYIGCDGRTAVTMPQFLRVKEILSFTLALYTTEFGMDDISDIEKTLYVYYKNSTKDLFSTKTSSEDISNASIIKNAKQKRLSYFFCESTHNKNSDGTSTFVCSNWRDINNPYFHTSSQINAQRCDNLVSVDKYQYMTKFEKYDYSNYTYTYKKQVGMTFNSNGTPVPKYETYTTSFNDIIFSNSNNYKNETKISTKIPCVYEGGSIVSYTYPMTSDTENTLLFALELNGPTEGNEKLYEANESMYPDLKDDKGNTFNSFSFVESVNLVKLPTDFNNYITKSAATPVYTTVSYPTNSSDLNVNTLIEYLKEYLHRYNTNQPGLDGLEKTNSGDLIIQPETIVFNDTNKTVTFRMLIGYSTELKCTEPLNVTGQSSYVCGGHVGCAGHYKLHMEIVQPTLKETFDCILDQYNGRYADGEADFYLKDESDLIEFYTDSMEEDWKDYELPEILMDLLSSSGLEYGEEINGIYEIFSTLDETIPFDKIVN